MYFCSTVPFVHLLSCVIFKACSYTPGDRIFLSSEELFHNMYGLDVFVCFFPTYFLELLSEENPALCLSHVWKSPNCVRDNIFDPLKYSYHSLPGIGVKVPSNSCFKPCPVFGGDFCTLLTIDQRKTSNCQSSYMLPITTSTITVH